MKRKDLRMIAGIILHPVRLLWMRYYRPFDNYLLASRAERRNNDKMWERMHHMSKVTGTAYTTSELYDKIGCY